MKAVWHCLLLVLALCVLEVHAYSAMTTALDQFVLRNCHVLGPWGHGARGSLLWSGVEVEWILSVQFIRLVKVLLLVLLGWGSLLWITTVSSTRDENRVILAEASWWETIIGMGDMIAVVWFHDVLDFVLDCEAIRFSKWWRRVLEWLLLAMTTHWLHVTRGSDVVLTRVTEDSLAWVATLGSIA